MTKTLLVTGGAGFIGSHLVPVLLQAGHRVRILDPLSPQIHGDLPGTGSATPLDWLARDGVEFLRASVLDLPALDAALDGVDAVIHLAAETGTGQSMYEIARYNDVNSQGTALLMQAIADRKVRGDAIPDRVVLASSRSVYGEGAYETASGHRLVPGARTAAALAAAKDGSGSWDPVDSATGAPLTLVATREDDATAPASIYAATKLAQEDLVRIACDALGMGHAILRLQNVYGEGQSLSNPYTGILAVFSTRIRRGLDLPIFEDGAESRDFVHVSDVAAAFAAAATADASPDAVINVGSGVATPVTGVAEGLARAFGAEPDLRVTGQYRLGDIRHNAADVTRLHDRLGLAPLVTLDEGLRRFAAWVGEQPLPEDRLAEANAALAKRGMMG